MASLTITTRQTKSGARYVVRYRVGGRAYPLVHGGSFKTLKQARARRDLIAGELAAGCNPAEVLAAIAVTPPVPRTFASLAEAWVASRHDVTAKQRADYRHPLRLMIDPDALVDFGPRDPATITAAEVREFVGKLAASYNPSTVRAYFTPLAQILDFAELQPNPARHKSVKLPGRQQEEPTPITLAEFRALLACMPRKYVLPMRLLEATALRVGELVKLQWGDVDLRSSRLRVSRARTKGRTSGQRFAQLPPPLMDELQELLPFEDRTAERRISSG
jgi:integrase